MSTCFEKITTPRRMGEGVTSYGQNHRKKTVFFYDFPKSRYVSFKRVCWFQSGLCLAEEGVPTSKKSMVVAGPEEEVAKVVVVGGEDMAEVVGMEREETMMIEMVVMAVVEMEAEEGETEEVKEETWSQRYVPWIAQVMEHTSL